MNSLLVRIASIVAAVSCRGTASPSEARSTAQTASAAHVEVLSVSKPIPRAAGRGHHRLPGVSNYLIGNDAKSWRTGIANYAQVEYDSIYPGIDLVYYGNQRQLEYDFTVAPGSDPRAIRFAMSGADAITIDASGNLIMKAAGSELTHHAPIAYQTI